MKKKFNQKGFTLLEILLVVAAIAILASIVIVAINPKKQLDATKDAQRQANVNTILNAVYQYAIDNNGTIPTNITNITTEICETDEADCTGLTDLSVLTTNAEYLVSIPLDPSVSAGTGLTGYDIVAETNGRVTVSSMANSAISVTR